MNNEKEWFALMDERGMFLEEYKIDNNIFLIRKQTITSTWGSSPKLFNKKAFDIYVIPFIKEMNNHTWKVIKINKSKMEIVQVKKNG